jgi:hypothetical protein
MCCMLEWPTARLVGPTLSALLIVPLISSSTKASGMLIEVRSITTRSRYGLLLPQTRHSNGLNLEPGRKDTCARAAAGFQMQAVSPCVRRATGHGSGGAWSQNHNSPQQSTMYIQLHQAGGTDAYIHAVLLFKHAAAASPAWNRLCTLQRAGVQIPNTHLIAVLRSNTSPGTAVLQCCTTSDGGRCGQG